MAIKLTENHLSKLSCYSSSSNVDDRTPSREKEEAKVFSVALPALKKVDSPRSSTSSSEDHSLSLGDSPVIVRWHRKISIPSSLDNGEDLPRKRSMSLLDIGPSYSLLSSAIFSYLGDRTPNSKEEEVTVFSFVLPPKLERAGSSDKLISSSSDFEEDLPRKRSMSLLDIGPSNSSLSTTTLSSDQYSPHSSITSDEERVISFR